MTDCYLVTGLIDPDRFLGGRLRLDRAAADEALAAIAQQLGITGPNAAAQAAWGALRVATSGMVTELFKTMASRGYDPAEFALLPFGGAGPTHANLLAEEAEIFRILVPGAAATFCALGAVSADLRRDFVRSLRRRLDPASTAELAALFAALNDDARAWLSGEGDLARSVDFQHAVDMRYAGQAYELRIPLPNGAAEQTLLTEAFHIAHERLYGFRDEAAPIELSTARLAIIGRVDPVTLPRMPAHAGPPAPRIRRPIFLGAGWVEATVYDRTALGAGQNIAGPAIIEQEDTTTLLLPGWQARVDDHGSLDLAREKDVP